MKEYIGNFNTQGLHFAIVCSRFNELITKSLLEGALDALHRHGVSEENIALSWVPGAVEIPIVAQSFAKTKKYNAIICLSAVIRGSTSHYDYVCNQVSSGIAHIALQTGIPTIFGVLTTNTIEEAFERAGTKCGNKGFDSALTAIEMANLIKAISQ